MSKFRVKLKLTGLELEIEGSREDVPLLTSNVAAQLAGALMPAANIAEGKARPLLARDPIPATATVVAPIPSARTSRKRRSNSSGGGDGASNDGALIWQHDANTWGNPLLKWKAVEKAIYLLYVAKQIGVADQMTVWQMVQTFERHFRTAGKLNKGNIVRDFKNLNSEPPPKVQMNGSATPAAWYLTDAGIKIAENLVKAARGEPIEA
jgi:hypothetical protein